MSRNERPAALADALAALVAKPRRWLVTGSAGFIGSHLVEALLQNGQEVVGLDNFSTGSRDTLDSVRKSVGDSAWRRHTFIEGDIVDRATCARACVGVSVVLHEAALGSVPRSIADPLATHAANATGFLNFLVAARDAGVERFVYAASSATYGDHPGLPKIEDRIGRPLSPYAVTKLVDELYADVFARCYGLASIGLRYFNVFGPRQDPDGAYAAVIPRFVDAMLAGRAITIYGDGSTTRDFCYVANVVQANILAAVCTDPAAIGQVYNVAVGGRLSLNDLYAALEPIVRARHPHVDVPPPRYEPFRAGDVRHSQADIGKARALLGYEPTHDVAQGLLESMAWYERRVAPKARRIAGAR
ncbi:MAG TPA: SDR family oxidoreductase [Casimicrobiaceae bacterium]|nr:SDR family oxidoreductase [Casimicrobiaceae bacterium]